jgi:hypothetical protein
MSMNVSLLPTPLPGGIKNLPVTDHKWPSKPLVHIAFAVDLTTGQQQAIDQRYVGSSVGGSTDANGNKTTGTTAQGKVFMKLSATSFRDAVSAASQLADTRSIGLNIRGIAGGTGQRASIAVAVLQGLDGVYYATQLKGESGGFATIDTNHANVHVTAVDRINTDLKAVVGASSWVNFTDENIDPKLAG